jgi:hypothetical protein
MPIAYQADPTQRPRDGGAQMEAVSMNLERVVMISHASEVAEWIARPAGLEETDETDWCHILPRAASSRQTVPLRRIRLGVETVRYQSTVHTHIHSASLLNEIIIIIIIIIIISITNILS